MWGQTFPNAQKRSKSWSFAPLAFQAFPLSAGGLRPKGPLKPASSQKKGLIDLRALEWGSKGQRPRESLSTFFSEESRGPSRPERQMKRSLRGKSQTGKGERYGEKCAHKQRRTGKQATGTKIRIKPAGTARPAGREQGSSKQKRGNPPGRALCADPAGSSGFFRYMMGAYE